MFHTVGLSHDDESLIDFDVDHDTDNNSVTDECVLDVDSVNDVSVNATVTDTDTSVSCLLYTSPSPRD